MPRPTNGSISTGKGGSKIATVGISAFAVEALTDLVFIELPEVGRQVKAGESFGEIESVKAVSDLYSPVDGESRRRVHKDPPSKLETLDDDPYGRRSATATGLDRLKIKASSERTNGLLANLLEAVTDQNDVSTQAMRLRKSGASIRQRRSSFTVRSCIDIPHADIDLTS